MNTISTHKNILHKVWKFSKFLPPQEEIILSVLNKNNTLALLPTGGGKSICYQLPALMQEGITLVISPLLALIKDQIESLHQKGIKAYYISSEQSFMHQIDVFDYIKNSDCKLLYISPERLKNRVFKQSLQSLNISLIAIDEAHCVSEWGNDFRPSYLEIKSFKESLNNPTCIALTATATPKIKEEIIAKLGLTQCTIFKKSFERKNLSLNIVESQNKILQIEYLLKKHPAPSIIYVRTRKEAENIALHLKNKNFSVDFFHAGITAASKNKKQELWKQQSINTLVATNAFGMGIDKENVGLIIHYNSPYSLENYYQEIGRAGRNNLPAYTYLLYNEFDLVTIKSEFNKSILSALEFKNIIKKVFTRLQIANLELPEDPISFNFNSFCADFKLSKKKVFTTLQFLHNSGVFFWDYNQSKSKIQFILKPYQIDNYKGVEQKILESISRNITGVFNHLVNFNEEYWAKQFKLTTTQLKEYLKKWEKLGFIHYNDGNLHLIKMITARDDNFIIHKLGSSLQKHQKHKKEKLENLIFYISSKKHCRMHMIVKYFGETLPNKCEKCDVCMNKKDFNYSGLETSILNFIKQDTKTLQDILLEFSQYSPNSIIDGLQFLITEEKIKNITFNTYSKK